ncbi:hypothetical protein BOX15_Mlig010910g1, partial [Macrostomum lignano]
IMAHLLGSEYCLKSLSSDARDLHNVLQELIAKAGPVPVMSWKFPDKKACDLDIPYLLQQYAFCMDEPEANQVSHIVLLELVIDRYNLLLQVLSQFILTHLPAEAGQSSGSQTHAGGSSLGLAAKKFWNRMGQMSLLVRQLTDEARLSELRQQQQKEEVSQNVVKSNKTDQSPIRSAVPNSTKSCQTVETAFVPCDSCSEVQHGFSRISAHLSALCEKERLPSSLRIYRAQLQQANGGFDGDWLAASDLVRWSVELEKEANRLVKHFNQVSDTSAQLKRQNADLTAALEQAKTREVKFDQERAADAEKAAKSRRELESKMDKLVKQYEATVDQVSSANKALEASKLQLMKDIEAAKKSIEQQEELIKLLDRVKNRVKQVSKRDDLSLEDLELAVGSVGERLTDLTDQLCQAREETQAAATQCENLARQNESLQAKHRMTAERVAELSAENEQLKEALDELEEFKDNHRSSGKDLEKELVAAKMQNKESEMLIKTLTEAQDNLTLSVQRLKSQVSDLQTSLQKSEDEKRLLIEYPDLNGPVNQDVEGTGDPLADMRQQVFANETRIRLLTEQTSSMRRALERVGKRPELPASSEQVDQHEDDSMHLPPIHQPVSKPPPAPAAARQGAWQQKQQPHQAAFQAGKDVEDERSDSDSSSHQEQPFGSRQSARRISDPVPLWQLQRQQQQQQEHQQQAHSRPPQMPSDQAKRSGSAGRPNSAASGAAKGANSGNSSTSALQAYKRAKAATGSAASSSSASPALAWSASPRREIVYPCAKCNKSFKLKSDLAVHKNYCSGKT